uniref:Uncharacterized protein n=1 Tax=Equus caballus TaxID=9796 RepID=A0A9L0RDJ0_HORSE
KHGKRILHVNGNQKRTGVAIFISDRIDFKYKTVRRDVERYYITIKDQDLTIINTHALNIRAPKYVKQTLIELKGKIGSNKIIIDFNTPLSTIDTTCRRKINRERFEQHDKPNRPKRHIQIISSTSSKIHILLKYTRNVL